MAMEENLYPGEVRVGIPQPDIILPSQYFVPRRRQEAEQRLMIAVLHDALDCVEKYRFATSARGRRLFHEAKQWLFAEDEDWPYSFECICAVLELDSNAVRQRLCVAPEPRRSPPVTPRGRHQTRMLEEQACLRP